MKPKMLVIDDEPSALDLIRLQFEGTFDVTTAPDGNLGIEVCRLVYPDVILLKMKALDGDRAIPCLKAVLPEAKVFVLSAFQDELIKQRTLSLGADAYFEKNTDSNDLQSAVLTLAGRKDPQSRATA